MSRANSLYVKLEKSNVYCRDPLQGSNADHSHDA
jgi:hypothetical protein